MRRRRPAGIARPGTAAAGSSGRDCRAARRTSRATTAASPNSARAADEERPIAGAVVLVAALSLLPFAPARLFAQEAAPPALRVGSIAGTLTIDGLLGEPAWAAADLADAFTQTEPAEGMPATFRTSVRVLASQGFLVIGVVCDDDPDGIVGFSGNPDARPQSEDHGRNSLR